MFKHYDNDHKLAAVHAERCETDFSQLSAFARDELLKLYPRVDASVGKDGLGRLSQIRS